MNTVHKILLNKELSFYNNRYRENKCNNKRCKSDRSEQDIESGKVARIYEPVHIHRTIHGREVSKARGRRCRERAHATFLLPSLFLSSRNYARCSSPSRSVDGRKRSSTQQRTPDEDTAICARVRQARACHFDDCISVSIGNQFARVDVPAQQQKTPIVDVVLLKQLAQLCALVGKIPPALKERIRRIRLYR